MIASADGRKRACGDWLCMGASDLSNKLWSAVASLNLEDPSFRDLHASQKPLPCGFDLETLETMLRGIHSGVI
jgi:hypothetical protein